MNATLTVAGLFEALRDKLELSWLAGREGGEREILFRPNDDPGSSSLVGHLNFIHTHRIQVLGSIELAYLDGLDPDYRREAINMLFSGQTDMVLVSEGLDVPEDIQQHAREAKTPLFRSTLPSHELISHLQHFYAHSYSERIILHGVYMEVMGIGVLITGEASIGKSELALELVSRGQRLIADDTPEFARVAPDLVSGSCPSLLRDFLEVRGLGILNIRAMFGDSAIKRSKYLRLIIHLAKFSDQELNRIDRLKGSQDTHNVLGVEIPRVTLPVAPGRNLAVLVEAAARNHILRIRGYDAGEAFMERQHRHIEQDQ
ncbi:HPr(Ser) kinase/phosphatase [Thiohalobacter sp. IOR34]|uniref:HPr(Ser) kinase/phosphatase n=1 Tax=Thiohalobacter sp. IOR34 TaxID=3057176 RepID=UPI0025B18DDC|nr:HPr(Ser) kinase/phosphatase [Thiohalobacter sp. IOR34]WJW74862.1 HPr(Ser) kinase/phosphatase [Thiohalobacter sp. IOR34]